MKTIGGSELGSRFGEDGELRLLTELEADALRLWLLPEGIGIGDGVRRRGLSGWVGDSRTGDCGPPWPFADPPWPPADHVGEPGTY